MIALPRLSLLLILGLPLLSPAQPSPAPTGPTGQQESSSPLVNPPVTLSKRPAPIAESMKRRISLDIVVTGKSGNPVSGLGLNDFTLLDNGEPRSILSFRAIDTTVQKPDPPVEVILLIDTINVGSAYVAFERDEMAKFLRQNGGRLAQPVSVFMLTNDGVLAQPHPSSDGHALADGLAQIEYKVRTLRQSGGSWSRAELFQKSLRNLTSIIGSETKKPGRKLLIWASVGWPMFDNSDVSTSKGLRQYFDTIVGLSTSLREARISLYSTYSGTSLSLVDYYKTFLKGVRSPGNAGPGNLALGVLAEQSGGVRWDRTTIWQA